MNLEEKIQRSWFWNALLKIQRFLMVTSTVSVILMLGIVVVCRYILVINVLGYDEIILVGAFWMYFMGSSYAMYEESHIAADVVGQFISSPKKLIALSIIKKIVQVGLGMPLIYLAYEMLLFDVTANPKTIDWGIPLLLPQSAILVGVVLMTFYSVVHLIRDINRYKNCNF
ncbi:TRAP transporter small permease [Cloacibacillus evryensis]|uniref:TRAP transporter small permease subunit n=1 Tax=Cloacibacillus evryensis TaxID=508460 RepID=A0AAW5K5N8_9BACT|nr:TRAP transporter small permease subunit [Cloacibacillus evryensis]MCQ4814480.1 TRAP transporter small permease subunit [Cloacibacillus evryensis]